jgi:hypothetical protein
MRSIELDLEDDGRWIADVAERSGVMAYSATREQAIAAVERLSSTTRRRDRPEDACEKSQAHGLQPKDL